MEVIDFLRGIKRICDNQKDCSDCILKDIPKDFCGLENGYYLIKDIKNTEKIIANYLENNQITNSEKAIEVLKETFNELPDFGIEGKGDGIAIISVPQDWLTEDYNGGM